MTTNRLWRLLAILLALTLVAAACGDDDDSADDGPADSGDSGDGGDDMADDGDDMADGVTISYWLWDGNQQPLYQECADAFTAESGINVEITQFGWGDYWDGLTAGFATGDVPDVFTDHLNRYPEFIDSGVIIPLNDYVDADGVATDIYFEGLADLWVAPNGDRFGLPKDWDTVAIVADQAKLDEAGVTAEEFAAATWNPDDGGTFQEIIAKLSVDANGNRGDSADFDAGNVAQYGWVGQTVGDAFGQVWFSSFAASNGFEFLDSNPWGSEYFFADEAFTETISWLRDMIEAGYVPDMEIAAGTGGDVLFSEGTVASITDGSWKIGTWVGDANVDAVFIPTPIGPEGRASMFNGLSDAITTASEHPDEAWEWVKYMASQACQDVVGAGAAVFPAIGSGTTIAQETHAGNGVDVTAFTTHVDEGTTFLFPIAGNASEVTDIMGTAIDAVLRGESDVDAIVSANDEVNAIIGG